MNPRFVINPTIFFIAFECDAHLWIYLLWFVDDNIHDRNALVWYCCYVVLLLFVWLMGVVNPSCLLVVRVEN